MGLLDSFGFSDIELWRSEDMQLVQVRHAGLCPVAGGIQWLGRLLGGTHGVHVFAVSAAASVDRPLPTAQHRAPGCLPLTLARVVASSDAADDPSRVCPRHHRCPGRSGLAAVQGSER